MKVSFTKFITNKSGLFAILLILLTTLSFSASAHQVNSYSASCTAGPKYAITASMSNNNAGSNYRWQWKNTSGAWVCFVNGANTINGQSYNVTGAVVNQTLLTSITLTFTNPNSGIQNLELRVVISDGVGVDPCTLPAGNTWTNAAGVSNHFIHVNGTPCATSTCTGRVSSLYFNKLDGGADLQITNGSTFTVAQLGSLYNLEAGTSGTIGSVKYTITGPTPTSNIENSSPYNSPGTGNGAWTGAEGTYSVNLKTYSSTDGMGTLCHDTTINFILNGSCSCPGANVVLNPGFESGTTSWSWANGTLAQGTGGVACGSFSGDLNNTSATSKAWQNIGTNLATGTVVNVSVYAGVHDNSFNNFVAVEFLNASNVVLGTSVYVQVDKVLANAPVGPQLYTFTATVPTGTTTTRVAFGGNGTWTKTDRWCVTLTAPPSCTPPPTTLCTPPTTFTHISIANGNWTSASTWQGGTIPSVENISNQRIKITHDVTVQNNNIKLDNGTIIYITGGGRLTLRNGNLELMDGNQTTTEKLLIDNGSLRTSGNVQQSGSATVLCAINAKLEIGDEDATSTPTAFTSGFFSSSNSYTSANFQNTNGYRRLESTCLNVTHDLQNDGGTDIFISVCAEIGDQGPISGPHGNNGGFDGQDNGNIQIQSTIGTNSKYYDSEIYIPNGGLSNSRDFLTCNVDYRLTNGNYQNQSGGTLTGTANVIYINHPSNGNIQNTGNWNWSTIEKWRTDNTTIPTGLSGSAITESTQANILTDFGSCDCTLPTGSIGDRVWFDANGNGIQDVGELGIANATVTLTYSNGFTVTTTTDASGIYSFNNLAQGTYSVAFTTPAGFTPTGSNVGANDAVDSDPIAGVVTGIVLTSGQVNNTIDAGFYQANLNLGNAVWYDQNNDGIKQATETGIVGATVNLYADANNDNVADGAAIATTTTIAGGAYGFANLAPGIYIVGVIIPTGYAVVTTNGGDPDNDTDNDNNGTNTSIAGEVRSSAVTLTTGGEPATAVDGDGTNGNLTVDFGLRGTGALGNYVWDDLNRNGIQDAGEPGIVGATVTLTYPNGTTAIKTTGTGGIYSFTDLMAGTYSVAFTTPTGFYVPTGSNVGSDDGLDSDPVSGIVSNINIASGQTDNTIDAGFYRVLTLQGNVWHDVNGMDDNLVNNTGPLQLPPAANIPIGLRVVRVNPATGLVINSAVVAANGTFNFGNVAPGPYLLFLSTTPGTPGQLPPFPTLPTAWVNTGEKLGLTSGRDILIDGKLSVNVVTNTTNANFGIILTNQDGGVD